jgi:deoxyadenosine/deoxycytidine kinase
MNPTIKMYPKMPKIISIEGNIGAGKTTILSHIEKILCNTGNRKIRVLREPVDVWASVKTVEITGTKTILQKYYEDPQKYAFPFQMLAFTTRLAELKKLISNYPECEIILCERSLEADANIFAKMLFDERQIDDISYQVYRRMFSDMAVPYTVFKIFYLDIPVKTCLDRIKYRNRDGESNIDPNYLEKLKKYHDEWFQTPDLKYDIVKINGIDSIIDSLLDV